MWKHVFHYEKHVDVSEFYLFLGKGHLRTRVNLHAAEKSLSKCGNYLTNYTIKHVKTHAKTCNMSQKG